MFLAFLRKRWCAYVRAFVCTCVCLFFRTTISRLTNERKSVVEGGEGAGRFLDRRSMFQRGFREGLFRKGEKDGVYAYEVVCARVSFNVCASVF